MPNESGFEETAVTDIPKSLEHAQEDSDILPFSTVVTDARSNLRTSALHMVDGIEDAEDVGTRIALERKAA